MRKRKVLVFGTFDSIHRGHISFLKQARKHGDLLIGVVARDSIVKKMKGRKPENNEKKRLGYLRKYVDVAILGEKKVTYRLIKKIKPDMICIGYDQKPGMREARRILKSIGMNHVKLKRMRSYMPEKYKSSIINKSNKLR
jgi:cytidyltransferase-like protein